MQVPPSPNFLRVVAIGVQGLMDSQPRKSAEWLLKLKGGLSDFSILCLRKAEYPDGWRVFVETAYFEKTKSPDLRLNNAGFLGASYCDEVKLWTIDPDPRLTFHANEPSTTQKDMEQKVGRIYTYPYPVVTVTNEAIALAKKIADIGFGGSS